MSPESVSDSPRRNGVLYAEDDENDVFFMQRAFAKARIGDRLTIVADGQQALDYVLGRHRYADRVRHPPPRLVILDLKMPNLTGLEALREIRRHGACADLPVVFLTSSTQQSDLAQARASGANGYFVKPSNAEELVTWVQALCEITAEGAQRVCRLEIAGNRL